MVGGAVLIPREVIARSTTPDGEPLELSREGGYFVIRVGHVPLMSSAAFGSEQHMARVAHDAVGRRPAPRVLVGGLGMGFTLRAVLDAFGSDASVTVAELLPDVVGYVRGVLAGVAAHPLDDARVTLYEGDVRDCLTPSAWDAVLLDVDNGPQALTVASNRSLYEDVGPLARCLVPGGVLVVWSATQSRAFEQRLRRARLDVQSRRVCARGHRGSRHVLYIGARPVTCSQR